MNSCQDAMLSIVGDDEYPTFALIQAHEDDMTSLVGEKHK